ncbi:MAG TPA: hypothetical protein PKD51_11250 [Saprospiraceae bacterium]|nr:hypothetical protein [Saprospiraceae bacterium]
MNYRLIMITFNLLHLVFIVRSQERMTPALAMQNNLQLVEAYVIEEIGSTDSFLITKEYFNKMGRTTLKEIYSRKGLGCAYSYFYKDDTIRTERITVCHGKFLSKTKIWYDSKNREVKAIDYDESGKKTGTYSKIKYNDKKKTKETFIQFSDGYTIETKTTYGDNADMVEHLVKENRRWYDRTTGTFTQLHKSEEENYNGTNLKRVNESDEAKESKTILGVKGQLKLEKGDLLKNESFIMANGLIAYHNQYVNDVFIGMKRFVYFKH